MIVDEIKKAGQAVLNTFSNAYIPSTQESLVTLEQLDYIYNWLVYLKSRYR